MEKHKVCSFFGHRKITVTEELKRKIREVIEDLVTKQNVLTFLFGSRSDFNDLCHLIVTELKELNPKIERICYTCRNETCILENEKEKWQNLLCNLQKKEITLLCYEKEQEHTTKFIARKASYIERNQAMIDDSDYCLFYYDTNYKPPLKKYSKQSIGFYQSKSGTALAYAYAKRKKKVLINVLQ